MQNAAFCLSGVLKQWDFFRSRCLLNNKQLPLFYHGNVRGVLFSRSSSIAVKIFCLSRLPLPAELTNLLRCRSLICGILGLSVSLYLGCMGDLFVLHDLWNGHFVKIQLSVQLDICNCADRRFDVLFVVLVVVLLLCLFFTTCSSAVVLSRIFTTGSSAVVPSRIFTTCSLAVALSLNLSKDSLWLVTSSWVPRLHFQHHCSAFRPS